MGDVAYCDLCEMDRSFCVHGLEDRRQAASSNASALLVSPRGMAHFSGCPHKGDDRDYSRWAEITSPNAWQRLGNGEELQATGGSNPDLIAWSPAHIAFRPGPGSSSDCGGWGWSQRRRGGRGLPRTRWRSDSCTCRRRAAIGQRRAGARWHRLEDVAGPNVARLTGSASRDAPGSQEDLR
jgi:hypothetical protein